MLYRIKILDSRPYPYVHEFNSRVPKNYDWMSWFTFTAEKYSTVFSFKIAERLRRKLNSRRVFRSSPTYGLERVNIE